MATCISFQVQMASIMEVLTKTALDEITKLVDDASAELRLEMCRSQRENEELRSTLLVMEGELRAARRCRERTPGRSLNIALEVKVCDKFREAQNSKVGGEGSVVAVERVFDERLSAGPVNDEQYVGLSVEKKKTIPDALVMKYEPVDGEQDWCESVLLCEDWLEEVPKTSQSQLEQKITEEDAFGTFGAAAANGGEGPLRGEEELHMQPCLAVDPEKRLLAELKQEADGEPLTPGHPLLRSAERLEVQSAWSKASRSGKVREILRQHGGSLEHRDRFSPRHFTASRRLISVKNEGPTSHLDQQQNGRPRGLPDGISTEMAFPLGSRGELIVSAPCEESFDASAEAESCRTIEGREEFVYTCCGKTFPDALELQTHKEQHGTGKRFSCSDCGKSFPYKGNLKIHQRVHTKEKPFVCVQCGKSFSQISHLKTHQITHTGEKCFSCDECGKSFSQLGNLKTHQRVHTGEKPHSCNECGKSFAYLHVLKSHKRVHTGEKPHSCDKCGKSFAYLHVLKSHQCVHSREKPFVCAGCGKSFSQISHLKTHQITHTREKCFSCYECGESFSQMGNLKTHQKVHTGEKPHSCNECGKSFAYLRRLKSHQGVHTGEKPFSCSLCGCAFSRNRDLQRHILSHTKA